jgi:hypothetical protein
MLKNASKVSSSVLLLCTGFIFAIALWLADSVSLYAQILPGCSDKDQNTISTYSPELQQALLSFDFQRYARLEQQLQNELSPSCVAAIVRANQLQGAPPAPTKKRRKPSPPSILDHGDGTLSTDGVACGPSGGCIDLSP